ncbi:MFS transporter [Nocardia sp. NPDC127579]|uniref:MFS transporter n=1 Tax=Nocardia sp. NPDC127579 TaxID=3345402 RepID=UPI00363861A1
MRSYREVLTNPTVRNMLVLGALVRIPFFAGGVLLALHVVQTLHGSYVQAGVLSGIVTLCVAASSPWRGRFLDRIGLRRTILPSIVVTAICWAIAPFAGYWVLLGLASLAGLFSIPVFTVVRQAVIGATTEQNRQSALALEAASVEAAFMVGPILGVALTAFLSTTVALFCMQMAIVLVGVLLWLLDPPLRGGDRTDSATVPRKTWFGTEFAALCVGGCAAITLLAACELIYVAAMREFDQQRWLGVVLAIWGFGSLVGGLIYGALHRPISAYLLLAGLGVVTLPMALADNAFTLGVVGLFSGLLCAPTLTASLDQLSRLVPEGGRGEAIGWHGAALMLGNGLGSGLAGITIDWGGYRAGFAVSGGLGIGVGVLLALVVGALHRRAMVPRDAVGV